MERLRTTLRGRTSLSVLIAFLLLGLLDACGNAKQEEAEPYTPKQLALTTRDGVRIAATLYPVPVEHPAGMILVHARGSNRARWGPFAARAQQDGIMCLAIDMRGHGESGGTPEGRQSFASFERDDWLGVLNDIDCARSALLRHGADPDNLAIMGASIGANLALQYAVDHLDMQAIVLISPGLEYCGVKTEEAMGALGKRPCLLIVARGDAYAASSAAVLKDKAQGFSELREYGGSTHGTDLLATETTATEQILLWLDEIIGPEAIARFHSKGQPPAP